MFTAVVCRAWAIGWRWRIVGSCPDVVQDFLSVLTMLLKLLVDLGRLRGLVENLARRGWPGGILVRGTCDFMSWSLNATVVPRLHIHRRCRRCCRCRRRRSMLVVGFGVGHWDASGCRIETAKGLHRVHGGR